MMITNFSSGELSPTLNGRTDIAQYFNGVSKLINFNVIPTGGITRRKGTQRIGKLHGKCRLIPFIINEYTNFILEVIPSITGSKIYVWKDNKRLEIIDDKSTAPIDGIDAPWNDLQEINQIQYAQNYDTLIMVQKDHEPFIIQYLIGTKRFRFGKMTFDFTPDVKIDDDYGIIDIKDTLPDKPSGNKEYCLAKKTTIENKVYYNALFKWNGTKWILDDTNEETEIEEVFNEKNRYPGVIAFFNGRLYLGATRESQQKVYASAAPSLKGPRYNDFSTYVKYITVNRIIKDPDIHFFTADATQGTTELLNVTQDFTKYTEEELQSYYITGEYIEEGTKPIKATWNQDEKKGTLTISRPIIKTATAQVFSMQKWINRQRASEADYEYAVANNNMTNQDNSFYFEIASDQNDGIKWLANASYLVIGTESATYVMSPQSNALMQQVVLNGRYGTDNLQATVVDNAVIYFGNGQRNIREYYWNQEQNGFRSNNLALLAQQILEESPAVDFDFKSNPNSTVIITRQDGSIVQLLYDKNINVQAWSRIQLGAGRIYSVAVTRCNVDENYVNNGYDKVYIEVEHNGEYYLELLDENKEIYLDSWSKYENSMDVSEYPNAIYYNVDTHEEYDTVEKIPTSGTIIIGYKYTSTVTSMPIVKKDVTSKKRITGLIVRFYNSYMPKLVVEDKKEIFTDVKEPYNGLKTIVYPGESQRDVTFTLSIDKAEECNILAINANLD